MSMESIAWNQMYRRMSAPDERRAFSAATARRILEFARPHRRKLIGFVILSVAGAALAVATPVLAGRVVDAIVAGSEPRVVVMLALVIAGVAVLDAAMGLVTRWLSAGIGEALILDLRTAVFDHVQRMPVAFFTRTRTGALVSRLNNDVIGAQRAFSSTLSGVVGNLVMLVLTLVVMLGISWRVTLLALVLLPVFVVPARRMGNRLAGIQREAADHNAAMGNQMTERFSAPGATLVKLFGRPDQESAEFAARARRVAQIGVRTALVQTTFVTALTLVSALAVALVYGLGGYYALIGRARRRGRRRALAAADPALRPAHRPRQRPGRGDGGAGELRAGLRGARPRAADPGPTGCPGRAERDRFPSQLDDVRFSYPSADRVSLASLEDVATLDARGGEEVLHGVTLRAEPGQVIALVGSSGAGKSTIAQLVSRLYDVDSGAVRLAGVDVRELSAAAIRDAVGMVTQDGHLFHDSIRGNLLFARPDATEEEVWDALERARLADLVRSLPDGLATVVGERGYRLSGGERQRLTIARLLLKRPRVVVLDEATAALDSTSEAAVQAALTEVLAGRTALVIAHRLSTIRTADRILVVEDGQIVEQGTHAELLAAGGRYEELYRTQFAETDDGVPA